MSRSMRPPFTSTFALGLLLGLTLSLACRDAASLNGTALLLSFESEVEIDQVRTTVRPAEGDVRMILTPDEPGEVLEGAQTLRLLLPDELGGTTVGVEVEGFRNRVRVSRGLATADLKRGIEVEVALTLVPLRDDPLPVDDGGTADGGIPDGGAPVCGDGERCTPGQTCQGGKCVCDPNTCEGCCQGDACVAGDSASACGSGGAACEPCPQGQGCNAGACDGCNATTCPGGCCSGNTCSTAARDTCGTNGSACIDCDDSAADRCVDGACRCGNNNACGAGQRCVGGNCVCDSTSCASGCCEGNLCNPRTLKTCGNAGSTCTTCEPQKADQCTGTGACSCGTSGQACGPGQRCDNGVCVCDGISCPNGCCSGNQCLPGNLSSACGRGGAACQPCPNNGACTNGVCASCTLANCADGCCSGSQCLPGNTLSACGDDARACNFCDTGKANACNANGNCACGDGPPCGDKQRCVNGACVCDPLTCDGCCSGSQCLPGNTMTSCGAGGAACGPCDGTLANGCVDGACRCGNNLACAAGQRCDNGNCVCDATSCPNGCCQNGVCIQQSSTSACGTGGKQCSPCSQLRADRCVNGDCMCGANPACGQGQQCVNETCVCNAASCNGCCSNNTCIPRPMQSVMACGVNGDSCETCDAAKTNNCENGRCRCGENRPCGPNRVCNQATGVCEQP